MNIRDSISDEMLHALIDGELEQCEAERLYSRISGDESLASRVCVLRSMKDMMRLAYNPLPQAPRRWQDPLQTEHKWQWGIAAALLLSLGLGAGWVLHGNQPVTTFAQLEPDLNAVRITSEPDASKILLHIDSASPKKFAALLDRADGLLSEARQRNANLKVEILANSHGLNMLRVDRSPYASRIAALTKNHENLRFIVCAQSIARFTREEGQIFLLPEAEIAPTAIGEVVDRLQEGWTYIKI